MTFDDIWWRLTGLMTDKVWHALSGCCVLCNIGCRPPEAMRALKFHGDVGGAWLALDKDTWESHENHMTLQDAQDVQDIARCQRVSSAFFSFFLWIRWTIWTWSPHQEMSFANSGLEWIDHTRRLLAIENVCLDRSSLAKLMTSHQTSKIGRPRQSQNHRKAGHAARRNNCRGRTLNSSVENHDWPILG